MIRADFSEGVVLWRLRPADARDLARFIRENVSPRDLALEDADLLEEAAERLDPPSPVEGGE